MKSIPCFINNMFHRALIEITFVVKEKRHGAERE